MEGHQLDGAHLLDCGHLHQLSAPRPMLGLEWQWLSKPFWDPILFGVGEFTTHFCL